MASAKSGLSPGNRRTQYHGARLVAGVYERPANSLPHWPFPVVSVGASAGGLVALTELLGALPPKSGMAFVLIQNLELKYENALYSLLSRSTRMPVIEVFDGVALEPNHVYVIPPNNNMTVHGGRLRLAPAAGTPGLATPD